MNFTTLSSLAPAMALLAAVAATPVARADVVLSGAGSYTLGASTGPGANAAPTTTCGTGGQDALQFTGSGGNNIGIHSYACGLGFYEFGSRSSGENTYYVDGKASVAGTLTMPTGGGLFQFTISPGEIGAFGSSTFGGGEYQEALLTIQLIIDGNVLLDDQFFTRVDAGGALSSHHTSIGTLFGVGAGFTTGDGYVSYSLFGGDYAVQLDEGEHTLSYVMSSQASGNVISTSACRAGFPSGGGGEATLAALIDEGGDGGFAAYCGAGARSGDPFGAPIARALPEPASLALALLAAAAGAAAPRLRRRR